MGALKGAVGKQVDFAAELTDLDGRHETRETAAFAAFEPAAPGTATSTLVPMSDSALWPVPRWTCPHLLSSGSSYSNDDTSYPDKYTAQRNSYNDDNELYDSHAYRAETPIRYRGGNLAIPQLYKQTIAENIV